MGSCIKIDTPPGLKVTVMDIYNEPVNEALVALFDSQKEWGMLENPVQTWKMTDEEGSVTFFNLEEKVYYLYAEKDSLTNVQDQIAVAVSLNKNTIGQVTVHIE